MAKISTPKVIVKTTEDAPEGVSHEPNQLNSDSLNPSAHIIRNILRFSQALEVKTTSGGEVMTIVRN